MKERDSVTYTYLTLCTFSLARVEDELLRF